MAITNDQKFLLNEYMGPVAKQVGLGDLIDAAGSVAASEITLADGKVLIGNASGVAEAQTLSGDITTTNAGVTAIAAGVIVNNDVSGSAAIAFSKLAALTDGNILVGNGSNVATSVAVTGDVTLSNAGVTAIGANKVTKAMLATDVLVETTGTLTQANLLAIGTPVEAIAAPGAGKVIVVDEVELFHSYSTAAYATGADLELQYGTSGDNIALVVDSFVTATASASAIIKPSTYNLDGSTGTGSGFDVTANADKPIQFTGTNFTNGDAANVIKWRIRYHVITLLT